jgi:GntR family transcriptional repressor for pyruvate dehydrogenase complex
LLLRTEQADVRTKGSMNSITAIFVKEIAAAVVEQARASDIARDLLRSLIYSGELGPGDALPPERELAVHVGISRTALREALKLLEAEGFMVTKVGAKGGTRVADVTALERLHVAWVEAQAERVEELREALVVVERAMISLAAERRTPEDLERLSAARIAADVTKSELLRHHMDFHHALALCAHNSVMAQESVKLRREIFLPIGFISGARLDEFLEEHDRIFAAVKNQKPEEAAVALAQHMPSENLLLYEREWEPPLEQTA